MGSDSIDPDCPGWPEVVRTTVCVVWHVGIVCACSWFAWAAFETGTETSSPVVGWLELAVAIAAPAAPDSDSEIG